MPTTDLVFRYLGVDAGAAAQFDRMGAKTAALGKTSNATLASVKRLALGVGLLGAAIGVEAVKQAAQFQTALTRINTQANGSLALVDKYRVGILDMTAAVATSPTALAGAAFHIASVGQKSLTAAQQLGVLKIAAEGAKVGGADLTDVTNALAASIVSNIKGVKNYSQVMGVLNSTVGAGDMTMQNLADALGTGVLAAAKVAGLSIKDVGSALAVFGDNAIRGSTAGQRLTRVIMLMQAPSSSAVKALNSIGLSQTSLASDMRKPNGLVVALADLREHLKASGLTAVQQAQVIAEAFGRSRGAVNVELLLKEFDRLANKQKILAQGGHGFASSWAGYTKTFQYAWDRMRAAVQRMAIELGTKLLPTATKVFNWIGGHTRVLLVAAGAWAAFRIGARLATIAMAQFDVAADANPIGAIVLALEVVTAGFIIAYEKSKTFRDIVKRVFVDLATVVGKWAQVNLTMLRYVADGMLSFVGTIIHAASSAFGWIPGIGGQLKGAAHDFDNFKASTLNTLSSLATDAGNLGTYAGSLFATNFVNSAQINAAGGGTGKNSPFRDPGHVGFVPPAAHHAGGGLTLPAFTGGGTGGGGSSVPAVGKSAAAVLHITAKNLTKALAKGLLDGWQGYALTVRESLSTGTQHLLEQLGKQFEAIQKRMTTLVENAKTKLHDALTNERSYVQQMMSDAGLGNVPTVDSGYTGQTTRLTDIGAFLGSQAKNYALFDRLLRRLGHSGLSKSLVSQIAQMGPTQGIQYAQQILSGGAGSIAQLNAYQKQIARSAKAIGQDQYGSQVAADRKNLRRQTQLQERMAHRLDHLARDIGREVAANVHPGKGGISGKPSGLSVHEAKQLQRDLNNLDRLVGKKK